MRLFANEYGFGNLLHSWDLALNEWLGIPKSGWGEDFPSALILLLACLGGWMYWVSTRKTQ